MDSIFQQSKLPKIWNVTSRHLMQHAASWGDVLALLDIVCRYRNVYVSLHLKTLRMKYATKSSRAWFIASTCRGPSWRLTVGKIKEFVEWYTKIEIGTKSSKERKILKRNLSLWRSWLLTPCLAKLMVALAWAVMEALQSARMPPWLDRCICTSPLLSTTFQLCHLDILWSLLWLFSSTHLMVIGSRDK